VSRSPNKQLLSNPDPAVLGLCENGKPGEGTSEGGMPVFYAPAPLASRVVEAKEVNGHLPDKDVAPEHCPEPYRLAGKDGAEEQRRRQLAALEEADEGGEEVDAAAEDVSKSESA
jgi:hypothetical protein